MAITLATLPEATAQQVFDQVASHLLTQGIKSTQGGACRYRDPIGLRCAAGCLIGEDEYSSVVEGASWDWHVSTERVPSAHNGLIACLQTVHDEYPPTVWKARLSSVAMLYGLSDEVTKEFRT